MITQDQLKALEEFHIWSREFPKKRFNWKPRHPLNLMIVRAYKIAVPQTIAYRSSYAGCKSWVELNESVSLTCVKPSLGEKEFYDCVVKVRKALSIAEH